MTTIYTVNNKVLKNSANDKWLTKKEAPDYNPLGLPDGVMRFEAATGWTPSGYDTSLLEFTQVSSSPNVWDMKVLKGSDMNNGPSISMTKVLGFNATGLTNYSSGLNARISDSKSTLIECGPMYLPGYNGSINTGLFKDCASLTSVGNLYMPDATDINNMFRDCTSLTSVPLFDTSSVTNMEYMFQGCSSLASIPLFDTSSVTNMQYICYNCHALTSVPLFDTSSVTNMTLAFYNCTNVQSGALALYQQASAQTTPPSQHFNPFENCGSNTVTGAAELAQIPSSWGGTGA